MKKESKKEEKREGLKHEGKHQMKGLAHHKGSKGFAAGPANQLKGMTKSK